MTIRSYYAKYWTTNQTGLLGGVRQSESSRFGTFEDAKTRLDIALQINREANRPCDGDVIGSDQPPEIFRHCPGRPAQAIGGKCFGCGKLLTAHDARVHSSQQPKKPKQKTLAWVERMRVHVDTQDPQWGRVASDGEIVEVHPRYVLVLCDTIRATIAVQYTDLWRREYDPRH